MNSFLSGINDKLTEQFSTAKGWLSCIFDILLVAVLLFFLFLFLRKHHCARLIKIIVGALIACAVLASSALGLNMIGKISSTALILLIIVLVLLFPQEMRRTLWKVSSAKSSKEVFTTQYDCSDEEIRDTIDSIVRATLNMAKKNIGALIIIAPHEVPYNILQSGTKMDSFVSSPLLECVFNTKAPLHDGAVFIRGNRIIAAGCFLPLTQNTDLDKELGTRHRAAIGITETNNVLTIIVSEETGIISIAFNGEISRYYDAQMLHERLEQAYGLKAIDTGKEKKLRRRRNG